MSYNFHPKIVSHVRAFRCDRCGGKIFGEYEIEKRRKSFNAPIITYILCKNCKKELIRRRLARDELADEKEEY